MRVTLRISWLLVLTALAVQAEEPPREARELTPQRRLHRVTWTDAKLETRLTAGRVLLEAQDGGLLLEARDGRLWNITPQQLQKHETTDTEFRPLSAEELGQQLSQEVAELGVTTPTQIVVTKHYVICSTAGRKYAEWCGSLFERLHDAFQAYWKAAGLELREPEFPLPAIVLKDHAQFTEFAAKHDRPDAAQSAGYFSEPTNRIILFDLTAGPNSAPAQTAADIQRKIAASPFNVATTIHEATHQIAFNSGLHTRYADNPRWLTEGLAMFFEVPDLDSRSGWKSIGRVNVPRRKDFRETSRLPREAISLAELIRADDAFLQPNKARAAYAESWALTFFLLKTRSHDVVTYLKPIQRKPRLIADSPEARLSEFEDVFGDADTLERDWKKWMTTH